MASEDKSRLPLPSSKPLPPFSPEDEKKAQQELARLLKKGKGASKTRQWFGFKGKTLTPCRVVCKGKLCKKGFLRGS